MDTKPKSYPYPSQKRIAKFITKHRHLRYVLMACEERSYNSSVSNNWCIYSPDANVNKLMYSCEPELQEALGLGVPRKSNMKMMVEIDLITYARICVEDNGIQDNMSNLFHFLNNLVNSINV